MVAAIFMAAPDSCLKAEMLYFWGLFFNFLLKDVLTKKALQKGTSKKAGWGRERETESLHRALPDR